MSFVFALKCHPLEKPDELVRVDDVLHPGAVPVPVFADHPLVLAFAQPGRRRISDFLVFLAIRHDLVSGVGVVHLERHNAITAVQVQFLVEADSDLEQILALCLAVFLADDGEVHLERLLQSTVDVFECIRLVHARLDGGWLEKLCDRELVEKFESLFEVAKLGGELRDVEGSASAVLLPFVLPQAIQGRPLLDIDPLLSHLVFDGRNLIHVEDPTLVAVQRPDGVKLSWPDAMNGPRVLYFWQDALVAFLAFHPLIADRVRPVLCEYQYIEVGVLAKIMQRKLSFCL